MRHPCGLAFFILELACNFTHLPFNTTYSNNILKRKALKGNIM